MAVRLYTTLKEMESKKKLHKKINIAEVAPDGMKRVMALQGYVQKTSLAPIESNLIMIRASQMNGCDYCLEMHTKIARSHGESEERIYMLNAWRESTRFSKEEKAMLALTEELTNISREGVDEEVYQHALSILGQEKLAEAILTIAIINTFNRIGISTTMPKLD